MNFTDRNETLLPLAVGQVDVWLACLSNISEALQLSYRRLLSPDELVRWQRFVAPNARLQYLVGRTLLRTTLSRYAGVREDLWEFTTNRYGRPYIIRPAAFRDIQFNLSHTEGLVACAVGVNGEIGIDVERIWRDIDVTAMALTIFAPIEAVSVARSAPEDRRHQFFSYWTLKEAYIKARGLGLSLALDALWFDLSSPMPLVHFTEHCLDDPRRWRFRLYAPTPDHKLAVAVAVPLGVELDVRLFWVVPLVGREECTNSSQ